MFHSGGISQGGVIPNIHPPLPPLRAPEGGGGETGKEGGDSRRGGRVFLPARERFPGSHTHHPLPGTAPPVPAGERELPAGRPLLHGSHSPQTRPPLL
ncbi:hypothetical protein FKM82_004484 [Ascaphus truei]